MSERLSLPCFLNPKLDCPQDCRFYSINLKTIEINSLQNKIPGSKYVAGLRGEFEELSITDQAKVMMSRMQGVVKNGGVPSECFNYTPKTGYSK